MQNTSLIFYKKKKNPIKIFFLTLLPILFLSAIGIFVYRNYDLIKSGNVTEVFATSHFNKNPGTTPEPLEKNADLEANLSAFPYYEEANLQRYINFKNENPNIDDSDIVWATNINADNDFYTNVNYISPDNTILINKNNAIDSNYEPVLYAFENNQFATKETVSAFNAMQADMLKENLHINVGASYRNYETESILYNYFASTLPQDQLADNYLRPGHNEHQTGRTLDLLTDTATFEDFAPTDEFKWLQENAYKYGFILRYPEGTHNITGVNFKPYQFTYVGNTISKEMNLFEIKTLEEYVGKNPFSKIIITENDNNELLPAPTQAPKSVYLTFDDGPTPQTNVVLDILKERNIKATFFVVGKNVAAYPQITKRIVDEGHEIAIHTYSHVYEDVYKDTTSYLDDLYATYNIIYETTGVKTRIYRFPGGSINGYNSDISKEISTVLSSQGFIYHDWNVSLNETVSKSSPTVLLNELISSLNGKNTIVLLSHDPNKTTSQLLPNIIDACSTYEFKKIDASTPPIQFKQ